MKAIKISVLTVGLLVIAGGAYYLITNRTVEEEDLPDEQKEQLIGGEKDEHGCLGPAGYAWSEEAGACLRDWEIKGEDQKKAVKIALEQLNWQKDATVLEVIPERCVGCFVVKLENNSTHERQAVNIYNWRAKTTSLTPEECKEFGGEPLNTVGGATCAEGEENLGEVTGLISPNICCAPTLPE